MPTVWLSLVVRIMIVAHRMNKLGSKIQILRCKLNVSWIYSIWKSYRYKEGTHNDARYLLHFKLKNNELCSQREQRRKTDKIDASIEMGGRERENIHHLISSDLYGPFWNIKDGVNAFEKFTWWWGQFRWTSSVYRRQCH